MPGPRRAVSVSPRVRRTPSGAVSRRQPAAARQVCGPFSPGLVPDSGAHLAGGEGLVQHVGVLAVPLPGEDGGTVLLAVYLAPVGGQQPALCLWIVIGQPLDLRVYPDPETRSRAAGAAHGQIVVLFHDVPHAAGYHQLVPIGTLRCLGGVVDGLAGPDRLLLCRVPGG